MNAKNWYYRCSRISEKKFRQLLRCFAMDLTATVTATLVGISVRSINSIYLKPRSQTLLRVNSNRRSKVRLKLMSRTLVLAVSEVSVAVAPMARRLHLDC